MDNNYYNNMNQNQNQSTQNNQNGYNPYNSNSQGQTYRNTSYNAYNPYQQPTGGPAPRKPRRRSGFGATIGKCAAVALVFGLVAGGVFTGVSYVGTKALGVSGQNVSSSKSSSSAKVSQTSTGNAADLSDVSGIAKEAMPSIVAITNTGTVSYQTLSDLFATDQFLFYHLFHLHLYLLSMDLFLIFSLTHHLNHLYLYLFHLYN